MVLNSWRTRSILLYLVLKNLLWPTNGPTLRSLGCEIYVSWLDGLLHRNQTHFGMGIAKLKVWSCPLCHGTFQCGKSSGWAFQPLWLGMLFCWSMLTIALAAVYCVRSRWLVNHSKHLKFLGSCKSWVQHPNMLLSIRRFFHQAPLWSTLSNQKWEHLQRVHLQTPGVDQRPRFAWVFVPLSDCGCTWDSSSPWASLSARYPFGFFTRNLMAWRGEEHFSVIKK